MLRGVFTTCLLAFSLSLATGAAAQCPRAVRNAHFETCSDSAACSCAQLPSQCAHAGPCWWKVAGSSLDDDPPSAEFGWDSDISYSGAHSVYLVNRKGGSAAWSSCRLTQIVPGALHTIRARIRFEGLVDPPSIVVRTWSERGDGPNILVATMEPPSLPDSSGWIELGGRFRAPSNISHVLVMLVHDVLTPFDEDGSPTAQKIWFDDAELSDDAAASAEALRAKAVSLAPEIPDVAGSLISRAEELRDRLSCSATPSVSQRREIFEEVVALGIELERAVRNARTERSATAMAKLLHVRSPSMVVGWLDSMERAFLEDLSVNYEVSRRQTLHMFGGEFEAIQVVVAPRNGGLHNVRLQVEPPRRKGGPEVTARVVGHLNLPLTVWLDEATPYTDFFPDPLVDIDSFHLDPGQVGSFWVLLRSPRGALPAGTLSA